MDQLKNKSELSLAAAECLRKNTYYNAACHPMYYSCLQLIKYKLIKQGISLEIQASQASSRYKGNSHKYLIQKSKELIPFKGDLRKKQEYSDNIKKLKDLRERADYQVDEIKQEECESGIRLAKSLILQIEKI